MARRALPLLFLLFLILSLHFYPTEISALTLQDNPNTSFIRSSCRATLYPALCIRYLSAYATSIKRSELHLAQTALLISLSSARSTTSFVAKLVHARGIKVREFRAVKDCIENIEDSVDRLSQSISELGHMGKRVGVGGEFMWHMSNIETWVSAALTDESTCMDGFGGRLIDGIVKVAIRRRVVNLAQVTSNALALINRFASRHHPVMEP